jgi:hypothetical protein
MGKNHDRDESFGHVRVGYLPIPAGHLSRFPPRFMARDQGRNDHRRVVIRPTGHRSPVHAPQDWALSEDPVEAATMSGAWFGAFVVDRRLAVSDRRWPTFVRKRQRRLDGIGAIALSLSARGAGPASETRGNRLWQRIPSRRFPVPLQRRRLLSTKQHPKQHGHVAYRSHELIP